MGERRIIYAALGSHTEDVKNIRLFSLLITLIAITFWRVPLKKFLEPKTPRSSQGHSKGETMGGLSEIPEIILYTECTAWLMGQLPGITFRTATMQQ